VVTLHLVLRAAFFSRLALALLAVLGFSAPVVERQVDAVVQTTTRRSERTQPAPLVQVEAQPLAAVAAPADAPLVVDPPSSARRRYLEHRAWLI
jgi:hypothetical protein